MKKVLAMCVLLLVSFTSSAANATDDKVEVKKVYDAWVGVDSIYVMTDKARGKWCYMAVSSSNSFALQCFDIKEENK